MFDLTTTEQHAGRRLDAVLAAELAEPSREQIRKAILAGAVQVDGRAAKPAMRLRAGQRIEVGEIELPAAGPRPEPIPIEVLYEDQDLAAVIKPAGMVVHPAKGHWEGTLASALAHHFQQLSSLGGATRPGIVHRLDRDTSGVMVVAKTDFAHHRLAAQFEARSVEKQYTALVAGVPDRDRDVIDEPIGPHPQQREKMAIRRQHADSREARTAFEVVQRFARFALLRVLPQTGRTHQIRLHLAHIGAPVLCDRLYGGRAAITRGELLGGAADGEVLLSRQALHARRLKLAHPRSEAPLEFVAPLPADLQNVLDVLQAGA